MKTIIPAFLFFTLFCNLYSQNVETSINSTISVGDSITVDINNDGIDDFQLFLHMPYISGIDTFNQSYVKSLQTNCYVLCVNPTGWANYPIRFYENDTVQMESNYSPDNYSNSLLLHNCGVTFDCSGLFCNNYYDSTILYNAYIGIQINNSFGWINIDKGSHDMWIRVNTVAYNLTPNSPAVCRHLSSGIQTIYNQYNNTDAKFAVYNILGEKINAKNKSELATGIYIINNRKTFILKE